MRRSSMPSWQGVIVKKMVETLRQTYRSRPSDAVLADPSKHVAKPNEALLERIASDLFERAMRNGMVVGGVAPRFQPLRGGNTAFQVSVASMQVECVFKADQDPKIIREAQTIEEMRSNTR